MSSNDEIFILLCQRTILKGEIALKSALDREMSADQLFERNRRVIPSLIIVCARLLIQYGAGNCKKVYWLWHMKLIT